MQYAHCNLHNAIHTIQYTQCNAHNAIWKIKYAQFHAHCNIYNSQCNLHKALYTTQYASWIKIKNKIMKHFFSWSRPGKFVVGGIWKPV